MLVAQKNYQYAEAEKYITELESKPIIHSKKKSNIKAVHKVQIIFTTLLACSVCIGILLGYTQLAETKYRINLMQTDIKEIEKSIENLRVEVESVQRLDLIEKKAIAELGMQYPRKEQMVFLPQLNQEVAAAETKNTNSETQYNLINGVKETIQKLIWN